MASLELTRHEWAGLPLLVEDSRDFVFLMREFTLIGEFIRPS
jgi:hypothetical protein